MRHTSKIMFLSCTLLGLAMTGCNGVGGSAAARHPREGAGAASESLVLEVTTPAELPTLPEHFHMRFAQLKPEMTINEFKALFPEAYFVKRQRVRWNEHPIDAYELSVRQRYVFPGDPQVYIQSAKAWFYFLGSSLESWGEPEGWPTPPPQ
jgi:hypothetical protein